MFQNRKNNLSFRSGALLTLFSFVSSLVVLPPKAHAQTVYNLPAPGVMVTPTANFVPAVMKGIKIFSDNPLRFDFIIDTGNAQFEDEALKTESSKVIKYFLASLTVPEEDLWVNLSPYEKDRIIPDKFGMTEMGRDLLAQDYVLKQLTASLIYPEKELGQKFWDKVYTKAYERYGTSDIPVDTFNKVWVVPDKAVVYESGDVAYIVESHLKVMLEGDYLAFKENMNGTKTAGDLDADEMKKVNELASQVIREIILPEIENEVNNGEHFVLLRQIYHSMILATWFKRNFRDSLLGNVYVEKNKVSGVDIEDKDAREKIYQQYLEAFKVGVYNFIKEYYDPVAQEIIPRKYFSGGVDFGKGGVSELLTDGDDRKDVPYREMIREMLRAMAEGKNNTVSVLLKRITLDGKNNDFVIASNNPNIQNRSAHESFHEQGRFSEVISDIASQIGASARSDGRFDLRSAVESAPNRRITTSHGEIYFSEDGILVIIDSRFQRDHAGRGERAVYAKNEAKAKHELVEIRGWIDFAVKKGLATEENILNGRVDLGLVLRNYLNGVGENLTADQLVSRQEEMFQHRDRLHQQGLDAERGFVRSELRGSPEGTLYRGTTRAQWAQILRGETPQFEFSTNGLTWVTLDLESATAYSRREGEAEAVIIAYKLSAHEKVSALTSYGDLRRQGVLSLEDVGRVYDLKGNVLYDAENRTPSVTGEGLDFIIAGDGAEGLGSDRSMSSDVIALKRQSLLDQFKTLISAIPGEQRDAVARELNFSESAGKESLNHAYDFYLRQIFSRYNHNYDGFEEAFDATTRSQVTGLFQLAALDLVLGGATSGPMSEKSEVTALRRALQNSRFGIILEMLFVLYPKTSLPMFNIEVGLDDGRIYEELYKLSTPFKNTDDFIRVLEMKVLGEAANHTQESLVDVLMNDSNKRNLWLQSVFDMAIPLDGAGNRFSEFFIRNIEQRSHALDMPRMFDVFSWAVKSALETRPESASTSMGKGQEDWQARFDSNSRQDLLHGVNTGFHVEATGALVNNDGTLPSFSHVFWYSRMGIILDVLNELKLGLDSDVIHANLFEMGREYATYDDFVSALERRVFGEDALLSTDNWRSALLNDPVKRMNWLQAVLNMAVSSESEERRSHIEDKFHALTVPASFWPVIMGQATNPKTLREGFPGKSSPWASNNLRINNGFWALGPEKALGLVSRGIRGALEKSLLEEGFVAPNHEQLMERGFPYLPLSTSELPYGGVGWSNGILAFFTKDRLSVATADELQDFKARYGSEWKIGWTDKDEVVVKNSASWDALKYLFLSKEVFEENFDRLSALNLLGRVIVIDSGNGDTVEYFIGDNQGKRTSLKRELLSELKEDEVDRFRWQMASRLVATEVFKNEYRHSLVDGKSREDRVIEAANPMGKNNFTSEQIAETLREDLDVVIDVLIDSGAYAVTGTRIDYNGRRSVVLEARTGEASRFSWEDIVRELSSSEKEQYEKAKNEYAKTRALEKMMEAYRQSRIGRYGVQEKQEFGNDSEKNVGGIDLNPNMLDLQKTGKGIDINAPFDPAMLQNIQIEGFFPVIIQIAPTNLPVFMGARNIDGNPSGPVS